ncbi:MAG: Panacea domain-containing protein [Spirulinaceae cyanobacterium]
MVISAELEQVSKSIIYLHRELFAESPSPMKLQKLCYYAQGYALAESKELFPEDFQAWQHGPVVPELYHRYKHFQWRQISDEIDAAELVEDLDYLRDIVSAYGRYDGAALSTMTHREKPWLEARIGLDEMDGSDNPIPKNSICMFFRTQLKEYGEAAE